jgi:hypothetical protein
MDSDTDPDPIRIRGFDEKKLKKKNTDEKFFDQKLQFTFKSMLKEKTAALKRKHPALQKNEIY